MINWYPGHMAKARRILKDDLKLVDLVIEVLDARIPESSRNPDLQEIIDEKEHIIILNKSDLADPGITASWARYLENARVIPTDCLTGRGLSDLVKEIKKIRHGINRVLAEKGRKNRAIRVMIMGIPNVGKSALINALSGSGKAKIGDRPGVTRGRQWILIDEGIRLLDTPGILWPRFDDENVAYKLAQTGAIDEDRFDAETAAYKLIKYILENKPGLMEESFGLNLENLEPYDVFLKIGKKRGCLMSGGRVDKERTANLILNDFQKGRVGPLTLEVPVDEN